MKNAITEYLIPVLVVISERNKLAQEIVGKLAERGFAPTPVTYSHLPDTHTVSQKYALIIVFPELAVAGQIARVRKIANASGLTLVDLGRQAADWNERLSKGVLSRHLSRKELILQLFQNNTRPLGWFAAHLKHPAFKDFLPPTVVDQDSFRMFVQRLPPEELPEELRGKRQRSSDRPVVEVVQEPPPPLPVAVTEIPPPPPEPANEEYALLKEEYDATVLRLAQQEELCKRLSHEAEQANGLAQSRLEQVRLLERTVSAQQHWISPEHLPRLVEQHKEEARKHMRAEHEAVVASLVTQVRDLQETLAEADALLTKALEEKELLEKRLSERKPRNATVGASQEGGRLLSVIQAVQTLHKEGWSAEEALNFLFKKVTNSA